MIVRSLTIEQQKIAALAFVHHLVFPPLAFNPTSDSFCQYYLEYKLPYGRAVRDIPNPLNAEIDLTQVAEYCQNTEGK